MARRAILRPAARRDLAELYTYIRDERGDPEIAVGYVRRIRTFCESLATFPERGTRRDDIRPGVRIVGFERRAVVAFSVTPETIVIARIFYGGRDYEALLGAEEA
jgi:toxin ParE1/3/4